MSLYLTLFWTFFKIGLFGFGSPAAATTMAFLTINIVQLFHMYSVRTVHSIFASNPFTNKLLNRKRAC